MKRYLMFLCLCIHTIDVQAHLFGYKVPIVCNVFETQGKWPTSLSFVPWPMQGLTHSILLPGLYKAVTAISLNACSSLLPTDLLPKPERLPMWRYRLVDEQEKMWWQGRKWVVSLDADVQEYESAEIWWRSYASGLEIARNNVLASEATACADQWESMRCTDCENIMRMRCTCKDDLKTVVAFTTELCWAQNVKDRSNTWIDRFNKQNCSACAGAESIRSNCIKELNKIKNIETRPDIKAVDTEKLQEVACVKKRVCEYDLPECGLFGLVVGTSMWIGKYAYNKVAAGISAWVWEHNREKALPLLATGLGTSALLYSACKAYRYDRKMTPSSMFEHVMFPLVSKFVLIY